MTAPTCPRCFAPKTVLRYSAVEWNDGIRRRVRKTDWTCTEPGCTQRVVKQRDELLEFVRRQATQRGATWTTSASSFSVQVSMLLERLGVPDAVVERAFDAMGEAGRS